VFTVRCELNTWYLDTVKVNYYTYSVNSHKFLAQHLDFLNQLAQSALWFVINKCITSFHLDFQRTC
jgi:hypothetical protein